MQPRAVQCPGCHKRYTLPGALDAGGSLAVRCPACGRRFTLRRRPVAKGEGLPPKVESEQMGERPPAAAEPATTTETREQRGGGDPGRLARRGKRLARAIVSDMLRGQEARRERALADGSLLLEFGEEIRKAWERYQEKAGPELAQEGRYFRDALNEILADGKQLF